MCKPCYCILNYNVNVYWHLCWFVYNFSNSHKLTTITPCPPVKEISQNCLTNTKFISWNYCRFTKILFRMNSIWMKNWKSNSSYLQLVKLSNDWAFVYVTNYLIDYLYLTKYFFTILKMFVHIPSYNKPHFNYIIYRITVLF